MPEEKILVHVLLTLAEEFYRLEGHSLDICDSIKSELMWPWPGQELQKIEPTQNRFEANDGLGLVV